MSNLPPVWATTSDLGSVTEDEVVSITLSATDPESETITFSLVNPSETLPTGLSLSTSGVISGTPTGFITDQDFTFTVRATDGVEVTDRTFYLSVVAINSAPVWYPFTPVGGPFELGPLDEGSSYENDFSSDVDHAEDPDGDTLTFSLVSGTLPDNLTLTSAGLLSGVLVEAGDFEFTISASDSVLSTNRTFNFTVNDVPTNLPPVWVTASGSIGTINEGASSSLSVSATDPEGGPIVYTLNLGVGETFPSGLTLGLDGKITGIAAAVTVDTVHVFTVSATDDSSNVVDRTFTLTVLNTAGLLPPVWDTPSGSLGSIVEFYPSTFSVSATDPDDDPLTYTLTDGTMPTGLTVQASTGLIIGNPDNVATDTVYTFEITVSDGTHDVAREFSITVTSYNTSNTLVVDIPVTGRQKNSLITLANDVIDTNYIYRSTDTNFGIRSELEIYLNSGLQMLPDGESSVLYEDVFADNLNELFYPTVVYLNELEYAVVRDDTDDIVYEIIYATVFDSQNGGVSPNTYPQSDTNTVGLTTLHSNSLENMRDKLTSIYGRVDDLEISPSWMTTEQTVGDATSIKGWSPIIIIGYVTAGSGSTIIANLTDQQKSDILNTPINIDRFVLRSTEDLSRPTTFDGNLTTFDTNTTTFDSSGEQPRIEKYVKFPPGDTLTARPAS